MTSIPRALTLVFPLAIVGSGCQGLGFFPHGSNSHTYSELVLSLYTSQPEELETRVIILPARVAVLQVGQVAARPALVDALRSRPDLVSDVVELPMTDTSYLRNPDGFASPRFRRRVGIACRMARDAGAEYVFLIGESLETTTAATPWSLLTLTIAGAFVVPSTRIAVEGYSSGVFLDARDSRAIFFATGHARAESIAPCALVGSHEKELAGYIETTVVDELGKSCLARLEPQ